MRECGSHCSVSFGMAEKCQPGVTAGMQRMMATEPSPGLSGFRLETSWKSATPVWMDPEDAELLAKVPSGVLTRGKDNDYY